MFGWNGKIVRVDLTNRQITTINTEDYKQWIGGHGIATAIFFDVVKKKNMNAFDPSNVLVIVPGLFSGTLVPAAGRTEMVGIQAQSYPYEWFSRSNIGGRFASMLKYSGFDGIVLEGAASDPTWINIVEGDVELNDASALWGLDTYETQRVIFKEVMGSKGLRNCLSLKHRRQMIQRPAVLTIGPAGENKSRIATVQTDAGSAFGQGGFGGVWGAKNLKAISVLGTRNIEVANPKEMIEARLWAKKNYGPDFNDPKIHAWQEVITSHFGGHPGRQWASFDQNKRPSGCSGCHLNCKTRTSTALGNDSICRGATFYQSWDIAKHGRCTEISGQASNLAQKFGINAFELQETVSYLKALYDRGILGPDKPIETDLPFDKIGEAEFVQDLLQKIAYRKGIGDDLAEGLPRAAERWGRAEEDLKTGLLPAMFWGYPAHYDARTEVYWGYATIVSGRDINCHDFNVISHWMPALEIALGERPLVSAEEAAKWIGEIEPYYDSEMLNFANDNIYSIHMARTTAWLLYYGLFWKQSCGLCDNAFADFVNPYGPHNRGLTPEGEIRFYKAVTGEDLNFGESMTIGRKMFNLDKAIWTLQGRHRDMEKFPEYVYSVDTEGISRAKGKPPSYYMPTKKNGRWDYRNVVPRHLDRNKVEDWKTLFYEQEGWDPKTGWQLRGTLESFGLENVADELKTNNKLP
ncbi:MAG: aldehyde ferredoxin oxidoreductase N-terminal domain-containing protein [Deltaproteobacteria bacterium]